MEPETKNASGSIESTEPSVPETPPTNHVVMSKMVAATSGASNNKTIGLARAAAAKAAAALFPEDSESDRDDRLREAMTMFLARSATKVAESASGTAFSSAPLNMTEKMAVVQQAMIMMNTFPDLTGTEKKQAVVRTLVNIVKTYQPDISQPELDDVGDLASHLIEFGCEARRGKLDGAKVGALAADVVVTSCLNGWCVPKRGPRPPLK